MKKIAVLLLFSSLFLFSSLSPLPQAEGQDELQGTNWVFKVGEFIEYYDFHDGGGYLWRMYLVIAATEYLVAENWGSYIIEGNKLILIREETRFSSRAVATFSDNRQSFSYEDRVFELSTINDD
jgi:hypothetical protein